MVDRIQSSPSGQPRRPESNASRSESTAATESASTAASPRQQANLVERSRAGIEASDGVDRQQVDAVKTAIRNGEFTIDADQVARAFINLELQTNPS